MFLFVSSTVLSLRPGGLRRQLRFAARRFRIVIVLGGVYVIANAAVRIILVSGPIADWGPPALAVVLGLVFVLIGQDPKTAEAETPSRS